MTNTNLFMHDILINTIMHLDGHRQAQACKFTDFHGGYGLRSYSTQIIHVDSDGWLVVSGIYSRTTMNHIRWFMAECVPAYNYHDVKALFENEKALNIKTGETRNMRPCEKTWARYQRNSTRFLVW